MGMSDLWQQNSRVTFGLILMQTGSELKKIIKKDLGEEPRASYLAK